MATSDAPQLPYVHWKCTESGWSLGPCTGEEAASLLRAGCLKHRVTHALACPRQSRRAHRLDERYRQSGHVPT
jgi:hypothetical protein